MDVRGSKIKDPDEWLECAPEFSRPICMKLREWIFQWEPDLTEAIKWNALCYSGTRLICGMDACKKHATLTFFRGGELSDPQKVFNHGAGNITIRSIRILSLDAINREALRRLLHEAVALDAEPRLPAPPRVKRPPLKPPPFFVAALKKNRAAAEGFKALSPSCQREYIMWLSSAKRPETRERRLKETLAALQHGRRWADRRER